MKLLTFLGVANYEETCYVWQEQEHTSRFSPAASCRFLQPEGMIVFLTEEAEEQVYPDFQQALPADLAVQPVAIPLGKSERELWEIFDRISAAVSPGEPVAFDITHGLRSFPLVSLLAAAFLRSGLEVDLRAVLYGAFDVGRSVSPGRTPVFDLSPMISLLEWAAAADRFNRTGDARYLAALVENQRKSLALASQDDRERLEQIGRLGNLAGALESISQALRLIRPRQVRTEVAELEARIKRAEAALDLAAPARPFSLVLEKVVQTYAPLGHAGPAGAENLWTVLAVERRQIRWYAAREQWVQTIALAREWLVSWVMVQLGLRSLHQRTVRERVERVMGAEARDVIGFQAEALGPLFLGSITGIEEVLALWSQLTQVRNDVLHAGMRKDPGRPESLIRQILQLVEKMEALPLEEVA